MSDYVVTAGSTIKCDLVNGTVGRNGVQSKLFVTGDAVMVVGDLMGASIPDCTHPTDNSGNKTCTLVSTRVGGEAAKLFVQAKAALLPDLEGTTDGITSAETPPGPISYSVVTVGQSKMRTV